MKTLTDIHQEGEMEFVNNIDLSPSNHRLIEQLKSFLSHRETVAWEACLENERRVFVNGMSSIKDLQHRCPQCGKETGTRMTWLESYKINALWGRCFDCVSKDNSSSSINHTQE